jgi:hypothetical protein
VYVKLFSGCGVKDTGNVISGGSLNYLLVPAEAAFDDQASNQSDR